MNIASIFRRFCHAGLALVLAHLLAACGGGEIAGVGSGGSGLASGTVSGFGSIYVDGVEIEDAQASTLAENADGSTTTVAAKLGQRVSVLQASTGVASRVMIEPAVVGTVSQIDAGCSSLMVAGQLVSVNSGMAKGPLTVFGGGYLALSDVALGDALEIHGIRSPAAAGSGVAVMASRIEKLAGLDAVRVTGEVSQVNVAAATFYIGSLQVQHASLSVVPNVALVANGVQVTVWGKAMAGASGPAITASRIRLAPAVQADAAVGSQAQYSGFVSAYDAKAGSFAVQGVMVRLQGLQVLPSTAALADGVYVRVRGFLAGDGSLTAQSVNVQQAAGTDSFGQVRLSGSIGAFLNTASFVVRNVAVDASAINTATACPGTVLASGTFVEVSATQQAGTDVVKAVSLACPAASVLPAFAMRQYQGTASAVITADRSLALLQGGNASLVVRWNAQTAFNGLSAASLNGASVVLEAYADGSGQLIAREIRSPGQQEADRFDPRNGPGAWDQYDGQFREPPADSPAPGGATSSLPAELSSPI